MSRSSSGLGHCPFTAVTGVRVPYGMPFLSGIAQLVGHNLAKVGVASELKSESCFPRLRRSRKTSSSGNSSVGRAQPCQGWGREFESRFPLQFSSYEDRLYAHQSIKAQRIVSRSSSGLGHCPFTAVTGVRVPYGMPFLSGIAQSVEHNLAKVGVASELKSESCFPRLRRSRITSSSGNSSVGRAQPCQGWGREFESRFPLQIRLYVHQSIKTQRIVSRSSSGLGHCPFTAVTGVRVPYGMPFSLIEN